MLCDRCHCMPLSFSISAMIKACLQGNVSILVGIHGGHNSAVALIDTKSSTIVGNIEIERITRVKNDSVMNEGLISSSTSLWIADSDVEGIAYGYSCNPFRENPSAYDFSIGLYNNNFLADL